MTISALESKGEPLKRVIDSLNHASLKMINWGTSSSISFQIQHVILSKSYISLADRHLLIDFILSWEFHRLLGDYCVFRHVYHLIFANLDILIFDFQGMFMVARFTGIIFHGLITLPVLYFLANRENSYKYLYNCLPAFMLAFGTSSSAATLPMTIKCVQERNGISAPVASFVCSTGATINMDAAGFFF